MKLNKYFMLGLAGLAFAACSNEDEGNDILTKGTKQISVTISSGFFLSIASGRNRHGRQKPEAGGQRMLIKLLILRISNFTC